MGDREWMYACSKENGYYTDQFTHGVQSFINFALAHPECMSNGRIKCPCKMIKCRNKQYLSLNKVHMHILKNGFVQGYQVWTFHGETNPLFSIGESSLIGGNEFAYQTTSFLDHNCPQRYATWSETHQLVSDAMGSTYAYNSPQELPVPEQLNPESPNHETQTFYDMMRAADEQLWEGNPGGHSQLSATVRLLEMKSRHGMSEGMFNDLSQFLQEILPEENTMPQNYYETKKLINGLGLPVEVIHCCPKNCMLYWGNDSELTCCKICGHARYKSIDGARGVRSRRKLNIPLKKMHYFPLTQRLKRLYASPATASSMTWHATHVREEGRMCHPSDSPAWLHFDTTYPNFSREMRNVRLGLCTDGFQPFGQSGKQYSSWPVILTPYNLPPGLCMKDEFMFLSCLVPGPRNPKQHIDVFLQPLISELKDLWSEGVLTYDVSSQSNFTMRAALLWTINDFPAYSMLSGWSTAGRLACPHCMSDTDAFSLEKSGKQSWFDNHRKFLHVDHPYRRNRSDFRKGTQVFKVAKPIQTGEQILAQITSLGLLKMTRPEAEIVNASIVKSKGCGWRKRSIFWDLPYWSSLLIRHNIDVMHVEKNVFDNIFNTVMNIQYKTKDTTKSRDELQTICRRPKLALDLRTGKYPKATYVVDREGKKIIFDWVKQLRFLDGYASNMGRCVDETKLRMFGMKSHDCHVFMQRLLPIALREFLPREIWEPIIELCLFFKELTATNVSQDRIISLHQNIVVILCKLERIFPPSFFDSMEHLPVHLAYEANIAGPVQYRWMYPFERYLRTLKRKVTNKCQVEGSISSGYIVQEIAKFASYYFEKGVPTMNRSLHRNEVCVDDELENEPDRLEIFKTVGRPLGGATKRTLNGEEYSATHLYVLLNCQEITPYIERYKVEASTTNPNLTEANIDDLLERDFPSWFKELVYRSTHQESNEFIRALAWGPLSQARIFKGYYIGGYKFEVCVHDNQRTTDNSGVCVKGSNYSSEESDYYGILKEVIELEYPALPYKRVVLFKCDWFDPVIGRGMVLHPRLNIVDINMARKLNKYEPFVLAVQATQVFYCQYPSKRRDRAHWWTVCKVKARSGLDMPMTSSSDVVESPLQEDAIDNNIYLSIIANDGPIELVDTSNEITEDVYDEGVDTEEEEFDDEAYTDDDEDEEETMNQISQDDE